VVEIVEGSPAQAAGLRPEDLILEVDGKAVDGVDDLQRLMVGDLIGRTVDVTVHRNGRSFSAELTPVELDV
jgi:S1-C subfamily serine protease